MNSCGVNIPEILKEFKNEILNNLEDYLVFENNLEKILDEVEKEYYFSEWYNIVKDICNTPKSYFFKVNDLTNGVINKQIKNMKNCECFARLDSLSSKPLTSYKSSKQILKCILKSDRTQKYMSNSNTTLILREYLHNLGNEFRCYIHHKKLRGISCTSELTSDQIENIKKNSK